MIMPLYVSLLIYTIAIHGSMAMMSIGASLVLATFLYLSARKTRWNGKMLRESPVFWPTLVLGFGCAWSLVWAKITGLTFYGAQPEIKFGADIAKLWHLFFPFVLAPMLAKLPQERLTRVLWTWFGCGIASALLGVVQHYVPIVKPHPLPDPGLWGLYHATGFTGFHLSFASIIAFPTAVAFAASFIQYRRSGLSKRTLITFGLSVLFITANIFTYSKIHWAAIPLTLLFMSFFALKGRARIALTLIVVACSIAGALTPQVRMRFGGTDTIKERLQVWDANWVMIKQFPLFGVGWHHNSDLSGDYYKAIGLKKGFESHAHNNIVDQWATTGLLGLVGFIWLAWALMHMSYRNYRISRRLIWRAAGLGFLGGWFCLHLDGLTQTNFWDAKVLHQIGWVTALTIVAYVREP